MSRSPHRCFDLTALPGWSGVACLCIAAALVMLAGCGGIMRSGPDGLQAKDGFSDIGPIPSPKLANLALEVARVGGAPNSPDPNGPASAPQSAADGSRDQLVGDMEWATEVRLSGEVVNPGEARHDAFAILSELDCIVQDRVAAERTVVSIPNTGFIFDAQTLFDGACDVVKARLTLLLNGEQVAATQELTATTGSDLAP